MSSSGGALLSLAARGPQDVFLTGNPDTSYFRQVYRRHTPFAIADVQQIAAGAIASGSITRYTLSRQGDMVSALYIRDTEPGELMRNKIDYVRLLIGGQEIVKMTGGNDGDLEKWQSLMPNTYCKTRNADHGRLPSFVPIHFWFCEYWGAALPLCALSYHDVVVEVKWADAPAATHTFELWAKMIWLGNEERDYFVKAPKLSYVIDQWQNSDPIGDDTRYRMELNFNHPVKTLILDVDNQEDAGTGRSKIITLSANGVDISRLAVNQMIFNMYYHCPYGRLEHSTQRYPIIPFALDLCTNQPTGTLNFSRLENVHISSDNLLDGVVDTSTVTAVNTNVLIIKNGMGGLEFTN